MSNFSVVKTDLKFSFKTFAFSVGSIMASPSRLFKVGIPVLSCFLAFIYRQKSLLFFGGRHDVCNVGSVVVLQHNDIPCVAELCTQTSLSFACNV